MKRQASVLGRVLWHLLGFAFIVVWPPLVWFGAPVWGTTTSQRAQILVHAGTYLLAVVLIAAFRPDRLRGALNVAALLLGGSFLAFLLVEDLESSPGVLIACSVLTLTFVVLPICSSGLGKTASWFILPGVAAVSAFAVWASWGVGSLPGSEVRAIPTVLHPMRAQYYPNHITPSGAPGGGIDRYGDGYLVGTGDGVFHDVRWSTGSDRIEVRPLSLVSPSNASEFDGAVSGNIDRRLFRVLDLLVADSAAGEGGALLLVSHHYWNARGRCVTVRVSVVDLPAGPPDAADGEWRTLFESTPCVDIAEEPGVIPFAGHMMGGRMARLDPQHVLLTVGDAGRAVSAGGASGDLGSTVVLDLATGEAATFTRGHRNPEGLYVDPDGTIWLTEHGPRGGDELNVLGEGLDYGWPYLTLGVEYTAPVWPDSPALGDFEEPVHAWLPSIGVSSLVGLEGDVFSRWQGDLLVSSLTGKTLYRLRLAGHEVAYAEPIPIGLRIRDLVEGPDRVVLWTDAGTIVSLAPGKDPAAELSGRCLECHGVGDADGVGPDLQGVYGRRIGSVAGYAYSEALAGWNGRWTADALDAYLEDPDGAAPGTTMAFPGIEGEADRAALIAWLESLD